MFADAVWLEATWLPREQNVEADDLTNDVFDKFDPALRISLDWSTIQMPVMAQLLEQGLAFEQELAVRKSIKRASGNMAPSRRSLKQKRAEKTVWEYIPVLPQLTGSEAVPPSPA